MHPLRCACDEGQTVRQRYAARMRRSAVMSDGALSPQQACFYEMIFAESAGCNLQCHIVIRGVDRDHDSMDVQVRHGSEGGYWLLALPRHQGIAQEFSQSISACAKSREWHHA